MPIPSNYPVVGDDAFETATGVHAAAVIKAYKKGDAWLADRIYSGVPAGDFGFRQKIRDRADERSLERDLLARGAGIEPTTSGRPHLRGGQAAPTGCSRTTSV